MQTGQWRETRMGCVFAGALLRCESLEWIDHTALFAPCSTSRKDRFATIEIAHTASRRAKLTMRGR